MFLKKINQMRIWKRPIKIKGITFFPNSLDRVLALYIFFYYSGSHSFKRWLAKHAKPGHVVLDIGANQGIFTIAASNAVGPFGEVHSFEPDSDLLNCLQKNLKANYINNVITHSFALGSVSGNLRMFKNPFNQGDNRLVASPDIHDGFSTSLVKVVPLDEVDEIQKIDLVKIDVQGWEPAVIDGMKNKLKANPNAVILFEFCPFMMKQAGFKPATILFEMLSEGYKLKEESSGFEINESNADRFAQKINGKKYTDICAIFTGSERIGEAF